MWLPNAAPCGSDATISIDETGDRGAEMCLRRIPELHDERMVLERLLDDPALNTFAASVNQPDFSKAGFMRGADVLDDDRRNVARRERVEIDRVFDRNSCQDGYDAVTIVFMPPRTAKSPTTVMRRG